MIEHIISFAGASAILASGIWIGTLLQRLRWTWPRRSAVERRFRELRERGP